MQAAEAHENSSSHLVHTVNLKLAALGCAPVESQSDEEFHEVARAILNSRHDGEADTGTLPPVDRRIEAYLSRVFGEGRARLPMRTLTLDRAGLAKALSIPIDGDEFSSPILQSWRVRQGVLHNPKSDRRTTQGIFHVVEGGLPIPDDKLAVPRETFVKVWEAAFRSPAELLRLPFTARQSKPAECFVSLLLRPALCPSIPGFTSYKSTEIRFFAPGSLVSNLDFVENIFGNGGDPYLSRNDAALDVYHWSGHTGCVVLAPHLVQLTKKELGLPPYEAATERQRRDGMCWREENERYNNGTAFKLTTRDASGVMVTIIADNYFGYCKKEVKTQVSFAANLFGNCEEEHAGGALVYPSYDLGEEFSGNLHVRRLDHSFQEMIEHYGEAMELRPEGYAVDKRHPDILYVPQNVLFDLNKREASWPVENGGKQTIPLLAGKVYVRPSGYKVHMEKVAGTKNWRLIGTVADGLLCHKPCTVSGGGKSEISKSISDAIIHGPIFVSDFQKDFDEVAALIDRDYTDRFRPEFRTKKDSRPVLSHERSLGSVIKLLTPSAAEYTEEYNQWLNGIPQYLRELVFVVKRFHKSEWGKNWREHFSVDTVNGIPGNELKLDNRKLVSNYLRVGFEKDGAWRVFGLRKDFHPATKLSMEDDITASVVVPAFVFPNRPNDYSLKFVLNCETRLFQRPDDAIHRGYDKQTEADFSHSGNFFSNYEPLTRKDAQALVEDAIGFDQYTEPMQDLIKEAATHGNPRFFVSSAHPRVIEGKPSKNPRYLQLRQDLARPRDRYLAEMATRLQRRLAPNAPVLTPVGAVVPGRRNNPPEPSSRLRPLAVYNPIHFMELPELFMEYISSMTGKSPSTTGAGSEGALTKGPFNALATIYDLNAALVSYILTGHHAFVTAAGYAGPHTRVDHDISLLVPELWSRMGENERDPQEMIAKGHLEKCKDFSHQGKTVLAGRLGYRITEQFVIHFFGRVFNHPHVVLTPEMLRPELQDMDIFADGMDNIVGTHQRVALQYFNDGTIEFACPPLRALLHIMAKGEFEGKDLAHPEVRSLFTRRALLASDWYLARLHAKQRVDTALWQRHVNALQGFVRNSGEQDEVHLITIEDRLMDARAQLQRVSSETYLEELQGALGAEPSLAPEAGPSR